MPAVTTTDQAPVSDAARIAILDSGRGLLPTAAWLHRLAPDTQQLLLGDPQGGPWGEHDPGYVVDRVFALARMARDWGAEALVLACNTASIVARQALREQFEPRMQVVATVPAVKPAALRFPRFAVWATETTARSDYLADLIDVFASPARVDIVGSHDLADAIEHRDTARIEAAVADAARRTGDVPAVVLGCTHYPLAAETIARQLPEGTVLLDSAEAVARQTLRRIGLPADAAVPEFADDSAFISETLADLAVVDVPWAKVRTL